MLKADVGDVRAPQIELLQVFTAHQIAKPLIGDVRPAKHQPLESLIACYVLQSCRVELRCR